MSALINAATWTNLKCIVLIERSQTKKDTDHNVCIYVIFWKRENCRE
jgi:hypothetical protein